MLITAAARLMNALPPKCCALFPRAVVIRACELLANEMQALKLEAELHQ